LLIRLVAHSLIANYLTLSAQLSLCLFTRTPQIAQSLEEIPRDGLYHLHVFHSSDTFWTYLQDQTEQIDCLILHQDTTLPQLLAQLQNEGKLLPAVILSMANDDPTLVYHPAQIKVSSETLSDVPSAIEQAITDFLQLTPETKPDFNIEQFNEFLTIKQHRLTEKLQERLGYQGVYYKRNPNDFFRNLSSADQETFLQELSEQYRLILLEYFNQTSDVNSRIDRFVTDAFLADLSVSHIMEIHMDLMEKFSQQLKLEGRSDEILLDYRLTLIDVVAHLCEMYRRSIPIKSFNYH